MHTSLRVNRVSCALSVLCGVLLSLTGQDARAQAKAPASVTGTWRGTSICTDVGKPACHDEIAVYHLARADAGPSDSVETLKMMGNKLVNGVEEWMGDLDCQYRRASALLTCPMRGGMWTFHARADSLIGTLTIPSGQVFRNIRVKRVD